MSYRVTRQARRELLRIWNYIANDNEDAADRFLELVTQPLPATGQKSLCRPQA